jgi:hypothetical protein
VDIYRSSQECCLCRAKIEQIVCVKGGKRNAHAHAHAHTYTRKQKRKVWVLESGLVVCPVVGPWPVCE